MTTTLWIVLAAIVALAIWLVSLYNRLVLMRNRVREAWADIDVQLKRRYDLIPNLVETVKGYAAHEKEVFERVTAARTAAMNAGSPADAGKAEDALSGALKSLFAVAENYPQLKASDNFAKLQDELSDTENKIQAARRFYNGNTRDFNTALQSFPTNLYAALFHFTPVDFFELKEEEQRQPVKVSF